MLLSDAIRKRIKNLLAVLAVVAIAVCLPVFSSFASSGSGTVTTAANKVMTQAKLGITRTMAYSYAQVQIDAVYPAGTYSTDPYWRANARLYHHTIPNQPISDTYLISEGSGYQNVTINEGYLNLSSFDLCFAGNTNNPVVVAYHYNGK